MTWTPCPVCSTRNQPASMRCSSCGAAFDDPDVMALSGEAAAISSSSLGEAGEISTSRFLGFSLDAAVDGTASRKLAVIGAGLVLAGFIAPLTVNYADVTWAWRVLDHGPALALLFPVAAALFALAFAILPLPGRARSGALAAIGLAGIATLPFLGRFAGAPSAPLIPLFFVTPLVATTIALRLHAPRSRAARRALAATAALGIVAMLVPLPDARLLLPLELRPFGPTDGGTYAGTFGDVFFAFPILFPVVLALLPLVLLPLAVVLGWPMPKGVWDTGGKMLRPVGWLVAFFVPLTYFLYAFNLAGWEFPGTVTTGDYVVRATDFVKTTMIGRIRLGFLATGFSLWAAIGAIAIAGRSGRSD